MDIWKPKSSIQRVQSVPTEKAKLRPKETDASVFTLAAVQG